MDRAFLVSELQALAAETKRKFPEVREAAEKALEVLKAGTTAQRDSQRDATVLMEPITLGCRTKNPRVIGLCVGALQRLVGMKGVDSEAVPAILVTLDSVVNQGVDIQLKVLQTILSVLTYCGDVHGDVLGNALLISFKLHEAKPTVVNSTAAATLRQAIMLIFERVVAEDKQHSPTEPPSGTFSPALQDAYDLFSDLCLLTRSQGAGTLGLGNLFGAIGANQNEGGKVRLLKNLSGVGKAFGLELIESLLGGFEGCLKAHPPLVDLLKNGLCPLLVRNLMEKSSSFPLTLRTIRLIFLLLRSFLDHLRDECEVFLTFLIRAIAGDAEVLAGVQVEKVGGSCIWFRALALEVFKALCHDPAFLFGLWQRYDMAPDKSAIFTNLVFTLNRIITEKPHLLGINHTIGGLHVPQGSTDVFGTPHPHTAGQSANSASTNRQSASGYLDMGLSAVATAASVGVNTVNAMIGNEDEGKLDSSCAIKTPCLEQHDKAEPPTIPERYIYLLALEVLEEIAASFAHLPVASTSSPLLEQIPHRDEGVIDLSEEQDGKPDQSPTGNQTAIMEAAWPALLAALTFLMGVNLSDDLFLHLLTTFKALIIASDRIGHTTARNTFLNSLARYAVPAAVVKAMQAYSEGPSAARSGGVLGVDALGLSSIGITSGSYHPPNLSERNLLCLRTLVEIIRTCSPTLNESWHDLLEVLQNANYVLSKKTSSTRRTASSSTPVIPQSPGRGRNSSFQLERAPSSMEGEIDAIQLDIQELFGSSNTFNNDAFRHFTNALCRLSEDMIGVNPSYGPHSVTTTGASSPAREASSAASSPRTGLRELHLQIPSASRRRTSGLHMSQVTRPGEKSFAIAMLDNVAMNNISRLLGGDPELAWNNITNHLLDVAYCSIAPSIIRTQAAEVLNNILVAAANAVSDPDGVIDAKQVERQLFDVLSREIRPKESGPVSLADVDVRLAGLQTLQVVLETCGHALTMVWPSVFEILGSIFTEPISVSDQNSLKSRRNSDLPPLDLTVLSSKSQTQMLRTAFPSVNLICSDFVLSFDAAAMECAINTLQRYGQQRLDVNITLSAIGLIWNVSDTVRSPAVDLPSEARDRLWLKLLDCLLVLGTDNRSEVRTSALQTLFKCLELHGNKLPEGTWSSVLHRILFPLFDRIKQGPEAVSDSSREDIQSIPFTTHDPQSLWADTTALAFNSFATILANFKKQLANMQDFGQTISRLADLSIDFFGRAGDKSCAASLIMFRQLVALVKDSSTANLEEMLWQSVDKMKISLVNNAHLDSATSDSAYSQETLSSLIQVAEDITTAFPIVEASRTDILLNLVKEAVTYSRSPTYPADIDNMTPVQTSAINFIKAGADSGYTSATPSLVCDLAEYITLAFIGAFEYLDTSMPYANSKKQVKKQVTFIALSKGAMPLAASVFAKYQHEASLYETGAFERLMGALALPIKLRYECPPSSKFGEDPPLWQTALICATKVLQDAPKTIATNAKDLSRDQHDALWQQIVEIVRASLLTDSSHLLDMTPAEREREEALDYPFLQVLETSLLPILGYPQMNDTTLQTLAEILHATTQLWARDPETEAAQTLPREALHYWCFDMLFIVTSRHSIVEDPASARRTSEFFLPLLVTRCKMVLIEMLEDLPLRGAMPFERAREEELIYVLQRLLDLEVWEDGLRAVAQGQRNAGSSAIKQALLASPRAHLLHLYPILLDIATYDGPGVLPKIWVATRNGPTGDDRQPTVAKDSKNSHTEAGEAPYEDDDSSDDAVEVDAKAVAKACLKAISKDVGF
ncbi:hypothetical protein NliqN6_5401 [Naganishia liquefaciens]|uniref:Protein MON2 homolog n=1 Tax=Naganishia liquefaciens TaxID=104408 RepID=A0A8H3TZF4_9TREE|nr:hypothetical protein NliqN6_5401 [Naganishia liquefaciens]